MFSTLKQVIKENWQWRHQIWDLAKIDLVKTYRGAALGKVWLFAKPTVYILVYWFTLSVGMRSASEINGQPFLLWLAAGVFPWFFMSDCINHGSDVYRRYPYLVNRIKFPISLISTFYIIARMIILACMLLFTIIVCLITGTKLTIYLLQLPLVLLMMFLFWVAWSLLLSPLSAISKDFAELIKTLSTPFFWLSGIIFRLDSLPTIARRIMELNPVAWCAQAVRDCFVYEQWIWEDPSALLSFLFVFAVVLCLAMITFKRLYKEVPDVI